MTKIAIIGGGLAGTACGFVLKQNGYEPVIFEAGDALANGASGNPIGLYNPRFFADYIAEAEFYAASYLAVSELFTQIGAEIDHSPHGSLHLITTADKQARFEKMKQSWGWEDARMHILSKGVASEIAGIDLQYSGMFLRGSGTVSPPKLCDFYAKGIEVRLKTPVISLEQTPKDGWRVNDEAFDIVIMACGAGVLNFAQTEWLPVQTVRGQIAQFQETEISRALKCNVNYGGYITPSMGGVHTCGSTFQKWLSHTETLNEDNKYILDKLTENVPALENLSKVTNARASLRTASKDRLPIIGGLPNRNIDQNESGEIRNIYVSTAHGSHGIVTSYMAANMVLREIQSGEDKAYSAFKQRLHAARFLKGSLTKKC